MPELPDVEAAKQREAVYKTQIDELIAQRDKDRAAYLAAVDREIVVHVAAPVVNNQIDVQPSPAPNVEVNMKPLINVEPLINVAAAAAPDVTVVNPARRREIMIKRNQEGRITGAEVQEIAAK
jgi:hypothetical protein